MGLSNETFEDIESEIQRKRNGMMTFDVRVHEGSIDEITFREHEQWGEEIIVYEQTQHVTIRNH